AFGLPHGGTHWTGFPYFQSEDTPLSSGAREALTFGNALRRCHNPTDRTAASRIAAGPDSGIVPRCVCFFPIIPSSPKVSLHL
ncbi:MAG: hypothetical protein ABI256_03355, partial [Rhodoferax sp.]